MDGSCRICGNSEGNIFHTPREMMFGTREEFDYVECAKCGTLQIAEIPDDLGKYYPPDYFSFDEKMDLDIARTAARRFAAKHIGKYLMTKKDAIGKFIVRKKPWFDYHFPASFKDFPGELNFDSIILDFGCGAGTLLQKLHYYGFRYLTGADAFIEHDILYPTGVQIYKSSLAELEPAYDLVMLHHAFEHLPDPLASLKQIHRLLSPGKICLLRVPIANYAWKKYGIDWVQLDAPRHLYLYTENAIALLAERAGFKFVKVIYDSDAFQFWGSEQYRQGIPLYDERSYLKHLDLSKTIFDAEQLKAWNKEAATLNREGRGDQACFYLRKM